MTRGSNSAAKLIHHPGPTSTPLSLVLNAEEQGVVAADLIERSQKPLPVWGPGPVLVVLVVLMEFRVPAWEEMTQVATLAKPEADAAALERS